MQPLRCQDCRYWTKNPADNLLPGAGVCDGLIGYFILMGSGQKLMSDEVALVTTVLPSQAALITGPEFGCVNGEPRQ